jgi:hypothetical protein
LSSPSQKREATASDDVVTGEVVRALAAIKEASSVNGDRPIVQHFLVRALSAPSRSSSKVATGCLRLARFLHFVLLPVSRPQGLKPETLLFSCLLSSNNQFVVIWFKVLTKLVNLVAEFLYICA